MSIVALSPVAPEPPSPMLTSVTPVTPTPDLYGSSCHDGDFDNSLTPDPEEQALDGASSPSPGPSRGSLCGEGAYLGGDPSYRSRKPPPVHTGADWKVVLHLPEIEKWLRATSERVTQLSHSVGQDSDSRHVDVHLVQLKDICEDISDHVEQIHALLETEFSLKLLSYSVNIIVDIRTVQLLWHQLRVSVLVLKERLLQGLQDSNGNFTRQTDILQAFSQDQQQTRLDALTEVDDCGQLTIRCSQDYFSLDCGITAFELSDYSPGDEPEAQEGEPRTQDPAQEPSQTDNPTQEGATTPLANQKTHTHSPELSTADPSVSTHNHSESTKCPLQGVSNSTDASPTQPSLPKMAAFFSEGGTSMQESGGVSTNSSPLSGLELSQSTPPLMDPLDRPKFWLELDSVYPEDVSQSYESLKAMNEQNLHRNRAGSRNAGCPEGSASRLPHEWRSSSGFGTAAEGTPPPRDGASRQMERPRWQTHARSEGGSDSSIPSPMREQLLSSDMEASGEDSDPRPPPGKASVWFVKRTESHGSSKSSPDREHWYGSEEFLALPAQLRRTDMPAMKLESLSVSNLSRQGDFAQNVLQDVDDWDLTDWEVVECGNVSSVGESGDKIPSQPSLRRYRQNPAVRFSPTSSSDIAPSLDESIDSGPLSDFQSEDDEGRTSADSGPRRPVTPSVDRRGYAALVQLLLEDIQTQDKDPHVWRKIECLVQQLDGFISWLQEALDSTENWTQPRQDLDSLRVYLDTHLTFKLNVDSHSALKESIMEEGKALLSVITCHQSGLKEILQMVSSQWDQLQRQIRRQHGWMLRALRCIQARLLYTSQLHHPFLAHSDPAAGRQPSCLTNGLKADLFSSQREAERAALEQMAIKLSSLHYPLSTSRRHYTQLARSNSLQEFEAEYQELWDWLMDLDAMVIDSNQLMMSEEQRHHLFKSSHAELMMMESRKSSLLGRAESLKRSGTDLSANFHCKIHNLTHTWDQLEKILSKHSGGDSYLRNANKSLLVGVPGDRPRVALSPFTNSLLEQLEARFKELKAWLRDTELLIFNSCLRQDKDASQQFHSFKSLCSEIRARRRGVASVLKLCQKLLQQSQSGPMAETGPDAEQHQEALQLLSINLERRWEAIVMQARQWQNRLKRELGEQQVPGNFLEPGSVDLHHISPTTAGGVAPLQPDDSWEWDETDMTITEPEPHDDPEPDLTHSLLTKTNLPSDSFLSKTNGTSQSTGMFSSLALQHNTTSRTPPVNNVYQVYNLHQVELYQQPYIPHNSYSTHKTKSGKRKLPLKSFSKDSSFSSVESLPDLLGGLTPNSRGGERTAIETGQWPSCRHSESESGIDIGETETMTTSSENPGEDQEEDDEEKEEERDQTMDGHQQDNVTNHKNTAEMREKEKERRADESKRSREEAKRRHKRGGGEALVNGCGKSTPVDSDGQSKTEVPHHITELKTPQFINLEMTPVISQQEFSPALSQTSSLESLLAPGVELFPSKDPLHRSTSLESCLVSCRNSDGDIGGSLASFGELELVHRGGGCDAGGEPGQEKSNIFVQGESTSGELSRRTLDLLKRLENIQSPLVAKMTRSVSDMTLRSSSPQRSGLHGRSSVGGHRARLSSISDSPQKGSPSLNQISATASLTELSSADDSSLGSEYVTGLRSQRQLLFNPASSTNAKAAPYRKQGNSRVGQGLDEGDAASLSMVVNISACTDEDEDDSDLLSSSTLTLTEEELGLRDEDDEEEAEERLSGVSSEEGDDDDDDDDEEMEGSYVLGLEYVKRELQSWNRPARTSSSSKTEAGLRDELQCGSHLSTPLQKEQQCVRPSVKATEHNVGGDETERVKEEEEKNRRNATRTYISQFVDDVENGNVEQSCLGGSNEDDKLLREESSVFTKKGESLREGYGFGEVILDVNNMTAQHPTCDCNPFTSKRTSSLVGELRGELPCHSSSLPSPPSLSPVEDCSSHCNRKAITIQEKFKFSSFVTEQTKWEVRDRNSPLPAKKWHSPLSSCCRHFPTPSNLQPYSVEEDKKENVHNFVMEIIDMTSLALQGKESEERQESGGPDPSPAPLTQIREKVLEHSHRPLLLRKGDFYSYLSLSSHDSDCGEVSQCSEEKSSTPAPYSVPSCSSTPTEGLHNSTPPDPSDQTLNTISLTAESGSPPPSVPPSPDIRDEETLFPACTEEVYLGPPLCYSIALTKEPRRGHHEENGQQEEECSPLPPVCSRLHQKGDPSYLSVLDENQDQCSLRASGLTEETGTSSTCLGESESSAPSYPPPPPPRGEDLYLLCDAAAWEEVAAAVSVSSPQEERSCNEGPPYLNPRARVAPIDSSEAECLADTKALESNMGAVMTKISVGSSATNPSKEPAAAAAATTRINPKINCLPMRAADREEEEGRRKRRGEEDACRAKPGERGKRGRSVLQQEGMAKQVSPKSVVNHLSRPNKGRSQTSMKPPTSRVAAVKVINKRPAVSSSGTSRM